MYHTLVDSRIFEEKFDYGTHDKAAFPAMRNAEIADSAYHGDPKNASVSFSTVSGTSRTPGFLTHTPKSWTRHFCEPGFLRDLRARRGDDWSDAAKHWFCAFLPDHEPVLVRRASTPDNQWQLVLGVCEGAAALVWPVDEESFEGQAIRFFTPLVEGKTSRAEWL